MSLTTQTTARFNKMGQLLGYFGVHYFISLVIVTLLFPLSKTFIAPIMAFIMPLSHSSLPKTLLIMTVMFWLGASWQFVKAWRETKA